jgi:periplasmic divalent cation tolerance protein
VSASSDPSAVIVLTTLAEGADASMLARTLVAEQLAACVNILPVMTSVYRWQGRIEEEQERQVIIKTTRARLAALEARLQQIHPYEVPELLVLPISEGAAAYLQWLVENTQPPA